MLSRHPLASALGRRAQSRAYISAGMATPAAAAAAAATGGAAGCAGTVAGAPGAVADAVAVAIPAAEARSYRAFTYVVCLLLEGRWPAAARTLVCQLESAAPAVHGGAAAAVGRSAEADGPCAPPHNSPLAAGQQDHLCNACMRLALTGLTTASALSQSQTGAWRLRQHARASRCTWQASHSTCRQLCTLALPAAQQHACACMRHTTGSSTRAHAWHGLHGFTPFARACGPEPAP
jgi:hypothetical protein